MKSPDKPAPSRNNGSKSAFSMINDKKPAFGRNNGNNEVDGFGGDNMEYAKKSGKSKSKKSAWSWKSSKSKGEKLKKPLKSENSPNFNATEAGLSFLTSDARAIFNRLWLAFTKALILWHFDLEFHIRIETDALGYDISGILSQLTFETSPNRLVTKTDLS